MGERHVVGVGRFGDYDFVARIEAAMNANSTASDRGGDDYVVYIHVDVEPAVVVAELLPQRQQSFRRTVFKHLAVDVAQRFQTDLGGRQIGLTDVEVVHMHAAGFGGIAERH